MAYFKKLGIFAAPMILAGATAAAMTGCNPADVAEDVCGPCGDIENAQVDISGSAQLDGFFAAVSTLDKATAGASAEFELGLGNLEAAFDVEATGDLAARVAALNTAISGQISANVEGGLKVDIAPAQCSANIDVSVQAQANCEASADCEVSADPGSVSVKCEGGCSGSCEGSCDASATASCEASAGGVACEGSCSGSCEMEVGATCEGTCHGECSGSCSVRNDAGECAGTCEGECTGNCELSASAKCEGKCTGKCAVEEPSGSCSGDASLKCEGKCEGQCSGGCTGEATPPSASADCEASAKCEGSASAQGSASMVCTPPSIAVSFVFAAGVDAQAQATFTAQIAALKANAGIMVGSFTKYKALIDGEVNGEVAFKVAPVVSVANAFGTLAANIDDVVADIPAGRLPCAETAITASVTILGDLVADSAATLEAQASFVTAFSGGFSSGS